MIDDLLPSSPNWYCSQASDANREGLFAYAARNAVFVLDVRTSPPSSVGSLSGHAGRVTAVRFAQDSRSGHLCATGGDDGVVRVWDVRHKSVEAEHQLIRKNVTALDWCAWLKHPSLIISGDEKGALVWWNRASGENWEFIPERGHIFCLASCPHDEPYVAVGYKSGLALIVAIGGRGQTIHKLRGHDEEIHSVCWCPALGETLQVRRPNTEGAAAAVADGGGGGGGDLRAVPSSGGADPSMPSLRERGCLLVTGSRDRTLRVWTASQGKALLTLSLPARAGARRGARERGEAEGAKARVWLSVCWPAHSPRVFLSTSYGGDVIRWDLCQPGKQKWEYCGVEGSLSHSRIVFNITQPPSLPDAFITTSMDRQIICWSMDSLKAVWTLPTLGGFVYCLSACPLDPACLALGVGDCMIRVWHTASPKRDGSVTTLWQGIKSKVTALCWHPERENCLAYGTDDGRIGIYNTFHQGKGPHLSSTFHKKTVYSLSWGPQCPEGGSSYCLYSCAGDGIVYQHDPARLGEDATDFNSLIRSANHITHMFPMRTDVSWRHDRKAVAIGNEDGSIEVLAAPSLLILCTIQVHHKLINCLVWYPATGQSQSGSKHADQSNGALQTGPECSSQSQTRYWLASGSNEPQVLVHDLTTVLGGSQPVQLKTPITGAFRTLNGHTMRITALSWSPHGDGQLVSTSYDSTAQVWDVEKGEPQANFRGHHGRVFSAVWSSLDPDVVFSGGDDFCVFKWRVSKMQYTKPPSHKRNTAAVAQRTTKGRSASSTKGNKKRAKAPREEAQPRGLSPSATTTTAAEDASAPAREDAPHERTPAEPTAVNDATDVDDVASLQRLLEEKRREIERAAAPGTGPTSDGRAGGVNADTGPPAGETAAGEARRLGDGDGGVNDADVEAPQEADPSDAFSKKDSRRKKKHRSLFPLSRGQDNRGKVYHLDDCVTLAEHKHGPKETEASARLHPGQGDTVHLGPFANRRAAYAMFKEEGTRHDEAGYREQSQHLDMWKGNLAGALSKAADTSQLNSFLVAMAPLGGHDVWLETAASYAQQLQRSQDFIQAATYYLACHKIHKALDMLMDNKLFREAAALASVRLSPYDPTFTDVYVAWARHLEAEGNYAQAAKCYLAVDQPANAVSLLSRRSDIPSLAAALRVSCLTEQGDLTRGLLVRYLHECLMVADWSGAQSLLTDHGSVSFGSLVAVAHEIIATVLGRAELISRELFAEPRSCVWVQALLSSCCTQYVDEMSGWSSLFVGQSPLLSHAVQRWCLQQDLNPADGNRVQQLYGALLSVQQQNNQQLSDRQLLIAVAFEVTLGQLAAQIGGASEKSVSHWLNAVVMCHDVGDMNLAKGILSLILPKGVNSLALSLTSAGVVGLRAHYLLTLLYHLWWEVGTAASPGEAARAGSSSSQIHPATGRERESTGGEEDKPGRFDGRSLVTNPDEASEMPSVDAAREDAAGLTSDRPAVSIDEDSRQPPTGSPERDDASEMTREEGSRGARYDAASAGDDGDGGPDGRRSPTADLCRKLREISRCLLSEPHAQQRRLQGRLRSIQEAVGHLVAQHARQGQQEGETAGLRRADSHGVQGHQPEAPSPRSGDVQRTTAPTAAGASHEVEGIGVDQLESPRQHGDSHGETDGSGLQPTDLPSVDGKTLEETTCIDVPCSQLSQQGDLGTGLNVTAALTAGEEAGSRGRGLPSNWDHLMADVKYSQPTVTYAVLMEEQERIKQDLDGLSREYEQVHGPYPDPIEAALIISSLCSAAPLRAVLPAPDWTEMQLIGRDAALWGLGYSWLTQQQKRFQKCLSEP